MSTKQKYIINARIPKLLFKKNYFFSFSYIKMGRRIIDFGEKKTTKTEFYSDANKKIFNINDINVFEILIYNGYFLY